VPTDTDGEKTDSPILTETEDRGQAYLDRFVFLGESTTYHLKSRGVLRGGKETTQVWGPDSGTLTLDTTILSAKIRYPETGELLTLTEAATRKRPEFLVLTFGLNGAPSTLRRGAEDYKTRYRSLIDALRAASPETTIVLQSCFPVAENMDMSRYSITLDELNDGIRTINAWTVELAEEYALPYLNTAEILTDKDGRLHPRYQNGDGHHLTKEAYLDILMYIRTHGIESEETA
jgi:lysophospholipase L1-like esterase